MAGLAASAHTPAEPRRFDLLDGLEEEPGESIHVACANIGRARLVAWSAEDSDRGWAVFHETYCAYASLKTRDAFNRYRGESFQVSLREVQIFEPGEVHSSRVPEPGSFVVAHIPAPLMESAMDRAPHFRGCHFEDLELRDALLRLVESVFQASANEVELGLHDFCSLLCPYEGRGSTPRVQVRRSRLRAATQLIDRSIDDDTVSTSIDALADAVSLSRYAFIRAFCSAFGVPPHRFITLRRLAKAQRLIVAGHSIADAAADTGFHDQSHLHRMFKATYGATPGFYRAARELWSTRPRPSLQTERKPLGSFKMAPMGPG